MNINLDQFDNYELAEIWNSLNRWKWHELLGEKPEGFDNLPDYYSKNHYKGGTKRDIISPIFQKIEDEIGIKECLRWQHTVKFKKTNKEFEDFWNNKSIHNKKLSK